MGKLEGRPLTNPASSAPEPVRFAIVQFQGQPYEVVAHEDDFWLPVRVGVPVVAMRGLPCPALASSIAGALNAAVKRAKREVREDFITRNFPEDP
jgi:hypothetical protein